MRAQALYRKFGTGSLRVNSWTCHPAAKRSVRRLSFSNGNFPSVSRNVFTRRGAIRDANSRTTAPRRCEDFRARLGAQAQLWLEQSFFQHLSHLGPSWQDFPHCSELQEYILQP